MKTKIILLRSLLFWCFFVLLGFASHAHAFAAVASVEVWVHTIEAAFRPEHRELNLHAFRAGKYFTATD